MILTGVTMANVVCILRKSEAKIDKYEVKYQRIYILIDLLFIVSGQHCTVDREKLSTELPKNRVELRIRFKR